MRYTLVDVGPSKPRVAGSNPAGRASEILGDSVVEGNERGNLVATAEALLHAVADGRADALALARELAVAHLDSRGARLALTVLEELGKGSPFALVRALELADAHVTARLSVADGAGRVPRSFED